MEKTTSGILNEEKRIVKLNPKEVLCAEHFPDAKSMEISVKIKNTPGVITRVIKTLYERKIQLCSGFYDVNKEEDTAIIGAFIDISNLGAKAEDIVRSLERMEGVLEVNVSKERFNGLMIDSLHFPLLVSGERSFTFRAETFGNIVKRLYEKFETGAAVVLYEMGLSAGEHGAKSILNNYCVDKLDVLRLILTERSAKGWCLAEVSEFNSSGAVLTVKELFECIPFKGEREEAFSQFFRGYLAGIFKQLLEKDVNVTEVECIAKGNPACKFIVRAKG